MSIATTEFPLINANALQIMYDVLNDAAYTPDNTMHFPSSVSDCMDFSTCNGGDYIGWFVHEVTHTWQFQNGESPFWGHIFSADIFNTGPYLSLQQYYGITDPGNLSTEQQADWHKWHYLCNSTQGC